MKEGLDVLRMLFYANLLSSQRDTLEVIEIERENDEKMDVELVNRRQQRIDDNEDREQPSSNSETTPQASTSSTAAAAVVGGGNDRSRTTTNDKDENGFPIENALQIKLGLKPNEYRYVQYPFDDFINEYANEKIEIRKEYLDYIQSPSISTKFSFIFYPFFLSTINKIGTKFFISSI
jgi:hypothetical protein